LIASHCGNAVAEPLTLYPTFQGFESSQCLHREEKIDKLSSMNLTCLKRKSSRENISSCVSASNDNEVKFEKRGLAENEKIDEENELG
jgi:hypothetical protein